MSILNVIGFKFHEYDEDSNVSYTGHELIAKNKFDEYFSIKLFICYEECLTGCCDLSY
jgi:hypothetical protein